MENADISGSDSLNLRIGDIAFTVTSADPGLKLEAQGPARHFLAEGGEPDVHLRVSRAGECLPAAGEKLFDAGTLWQLYRQGDRYEFRFTAPGFGPRPYKTASFTADFTSGEVALHGGAFQRNQPVYPMEYPLDELLMVNLLARGRGVEVHACGVRDSDGRGYLFPGQSQAGKTTTARLWTRFSDGHVLSDDRIILRFFDGRLWMYGTPWHGEAELASAQRTRVDRIFFLAHGGKNETAPLAQPTAVARLMVCSFVPFFSPAGLEFTLAFLQQVTKAVPCMEFRFVPDERAVDFVRRGEQRNA